MKKTVKDVVVLDEDLYLVHGKVIRANTPGMFEGEDGRKGLLDIADAFLGHPLSCTDPAHPEVYGFHALIDDPDGGRYDFSTGGPLSALPGRVKDVLRKEAPELAEWL